MGRLCIFFTFSSSIDIIICLFFLDSLWSAYGMATKRSCTEGLIPSKQCSEAREGFGS
jgi:hypothetical protein